MAQEKEKTQIIKISNKRGGITNDFTKTKQFLKELQNTKLNGKKLCSGVGRPSIVNSPR